MLKSRKAMWLILLILVFIVPVLFSHKAEAANLNWGEVKRDFYGNFSRLDFTVSSPGNAQVFFRTEQLIIIPHGAPNAVFTTQDLQAKGFYSTGSGTETISFSAEEIAQKSGVTVQQIRQVADTTGFNLGAVLGIYNGNNRIAEITSADQVDVVSFNNKSSSSEILAPVLDWTSVSRYALCA